MTQRPYSVLFVCTGNSARSIMAEAMLNHYGGGRFVARSAGSQPTGRVNPVALATLDRLSIPVGSARSKSWDEFAVHGAPAIDLVVTVCANAANEPCPVWPGAPLTAHWGIEDPAAIVGGEDAKRAAFYEAATVLRRRVQHLVAVPVTLLDELALAQAIRDIGALQKA
jgi:protein-tyrosine-phosphatase